METGGWHSRRVLAWRLSNNLVPHALNSQDNLRHQRLADVGPAERLGEGLVEEVDEVEDPLLEFVGGGESTTLEQAAGEDGEPDLDLIEPGAVFGGINESDAVRGILKKGGARGHVLEDIAFALASQVVREATGLGDQRHPRTA